MTLEQRHKAAAARSKRIIEILFFRLQGQVHQVWRDMVPAKSNLSDVKFADKLVAELLPKTYVLPKKASKRRA